MFNTMYDVRTIKTILYIYENVIGILCDYAYKVSVGIYNIYNR